ncbi:hypothetical protein FHU23_000675 [Clostridium saccharobutylicum]|nr:hypothetical protein [Clostridium saccharobutylicum]MBA8895334.1 hypothetical protein [Clostridium saccharobutylicum]MBA8982227.1 hypothetical protein [Clostridium saccharobutylicum]MBA9000486.1 hypothetical protein [Clostridium saccharobutylicum]MBA9011957.1 hypothetical protein [Clostridium saccharobutylicum]
MDELNTEIGKQKLKDMKDGSEKTAKDMAKKALC